MSSEDSDDLERLARAIAEGDEVDWARESARRPDLDPVLAELRTVEAFLAAYRGQLPASPEPALLQPARSRPAPNLTGDQEALGTWGRLRLVERIGRGSFGEVYRAFDPDLQQNVALKLSNPNRFAAEGARESYLAEARRLARVHHFNVVAVHGAELHEGRVGLWTDLVEGATLEAILTRDGPMGAHEAALVGMALCRALSAMHGVGLVHRDVKTTNVMRERGGRIVLLDFGAAMETPGDPLALPFEEGTPLAMAPEQLRGEPVGPAADIYGLGVLLYRLVGVTFPVVASSYAELAEKHARSEFRSLRDVRPDLPSGFVRVVERALQPDPGARFATIGAMGLGLEQAIGVVTPGRGYKRPEALP